jgi:predicted nucleic acid-binding protein
MIVIDANVAAKWLLPEAGTEAALALQEGPDQLFGPELIRLEVAAAIAGRVRAQVNPLPAEDAVNRYRRWLSLLDRAVITLIPESELLDQAVDLAIQVRHSLQDCMYLAAARRLGAPLITADHPFHKRASSHFPEVQLLPGCERN